MASLKFSVPRNRVMRGRKPKLRVVRELEGNPGKRPLPPPDPSEQPLGREPQGLTDGERATWRKVARECPWLRRADRVLVELFCRSWLQLTVADRRLVKLVAEGGDLQMIAALQKMVDHARASCLRMLAEMGATAASRARVLGAGVSSSKGDDLARKYFAS